MTLIAAQRLVRRIGGLLKQTDSAAVASRVAEDFAAVCKDAKARLEECVELIRAGGRDEAIELAEVEPYLPDLLAVLEFPGSSDWRIHCREKDLAVADEINAASVRTLQDAFPQSLNPENPLYGAHRRAVLQRDDEEALKAIRRIARFNPIDAAATSELTRLDAKVLDARFEGLDRALAGGDRATVLAEIESIEAFGFRTRLSGEIWRTAHLVRCEQALIEAARCRNTSRWLDALMHVDFVRQWIEEFELELPAPALKQLAEIESWGRNEEEKDRKEREFQSLLRGLQHRIQQSEEKDTSARYVEMPELRADYEALHKIWRALTDFTRPIPDEVSSAFHKRSALLEREIARRTAVRRWTFVGTGAVVALVIGVLTWFVLGAMQAREFAARLRDATTRREVHVAERLVEQAMSTKQKSLMKSKTMVDAEVFINRERALLANFSSAMERLPKKLEGQPDTSQLIGIAEQLGVARQSLSALAPDLKAENEPRLQAFEKQWQAYLTESAVAVNRQFEQSVVAAEKEASELDYRSPLEKSAPRIAALGAIVREIDERESGFADHLQLRSDLVQRASMVKATFIAYAQELKKLSDGVAALRKARNMEDFSGAITLIASSEFSTTPIAVGASNVRALNPSEEATLRALLGATNPATWAYLGKAQSTRFIPEIAMPAERQMLQQLNDDPAVSLTHHRSRLWLDREGTKKEEWVTVGTFESSVGWKQIKAWTPSKSPRKAVFESRDYGYFDGQLRLSPTQPVYRVEDLDNPADTSAFRAVGLESVWVSGETYGKPLLEVLDAIKQSQQGSPVFRAYLFLRLVELMKLQPDAWGLTFCPSALADEARLKAVAGGQLDSGDWFVRIGDDSGARIEQVFASSRAVSYMRQAVGRLTLARSVVAGGLRYVGFADLDGKAQVEGNSPSELWGYREAGGQPVLLATNFDLDKTLSQPLPLTPLFALPNRRDDYLAKAGVSGSDPTFRGAMPALFLETTVIPKRP